MPKYLLKNKHTSCITVCLIITANSVSKKVTRIQHRLNCYVFSQWRRKQCTWKCISFRYNQVRDSSQHYLNDFEDNPSRDNEEISSFYLGTLESSKNSGLSSSSYELSQYMNGAEHSDAAPQPYGGEHAVPLTSTSFLLMPLFLKLCISSDQAHVHQMSAPLKYSIPHAVVSFGPAGQLIRVTTGLSAQENVSHLEIHSLEVGSVKLFKKSNRFSWRILLIYYQMKIIALSWTLRVLKIYYSQTNRIDLGLLERISQIHNYFAHVSDN